MKKQYISAPSELNKLLIKFLGKDRSMKSGLVFSDGDYDFDSKQQIHVVFLHEKDFPEAPYVRVQIDDISDSRFRVDVSQSTAKVHQELLTSCKGVIDFIDNFLWEKYPHKPKELDQNGMYLDPVDWIKRK